MTTARFKHKTVVITGASTGVGAACAQLFARLGAKLVLVARTEATLQARARSLEKTTDVFTVAMDVADLEACARLFPAVEQRFASVDVLINNAGVHHRGDVTTVEAADLAHMIDVNLRAPVYLTRCALPYLEKSSCAAVVNISSLSGLIPTVGAATYSASKFGLEAFTTASRMELENSGVHVGTVSPGPIDTGFIMSNVDEVSDLTFSQPISTAEQVADAALAVAMGRARVALPARSGLLAHLGYLFPGFYKFLLPRLREKGRRTKDKYRTRP